MGGFPTGTGWGRGSGRGGHRAAWGGPRSGGKLGKGSGKGRGAADGGAEQLPAAPRSHYFAQEEEEEDATSAPTSADKALNSEDSEARGQRLPEKPRDSQDLQRRQAGRRPLALRQLTKLASQPEVGREPHEVREEASGAAVAAEVSVDEIQRELEMLNEDLRQDAAEQEEQEVEAPAPRLASSGKAQASGASRAAECPTTSLKSKARPTATPSARPVAAASGSSESLPAAAAPASPQPIPRQLSRGWRPANPNEWDDLSDPSSVFDVCDTDVSGGLDKHELRFALNAFGLFPDLETVEFWMGDKLSLDKAGFSQLVTSKLGSAPSSMRRPRAIPYARRGVSLGQLEALHRVFVESGWIQQRCLEYNEVNAQGIQEGKVHALGPNLYALDRYVIRPVTDPDPPKGSPVVDKEMREAAWLPEATHKVSYSELVNANGVRIDYFVSHWWGHPFDDTMRSLRGWAVRAHRRRFKTTPAEVVFWLCFLALNQHRAGEEVGSTPEEGPFNAALVQAAGAVMILDHKVMPFTRIWCLFEVKRLTDLGKEFELVCSLGQVGCLLEETAGNTSKRQAALDYVLRIEHALEQVSAFHATASNDNDKYSIWKRVVDPPYRTKPIHVLRRANFLTEASFKRFDDRMTGLLAAPLFHASIQDRDLEAALRYMALGAAFTARDLKELEAMLQGGDADVCSVEVSKKRGERRVQWKLLHCASYFGHLDAISDLAARQADLEARTSFGMTPLHMAASNNQVESTRLLLELRSDIESFNTDGRRSLLQASVQGHVAVVDVLLKHGANVNAVCTRGETPLIAACQHVHNEVVERLLAHAADVVLTAGKGLTALVAATRSNNVEAVALVLQEAARCNVVLTLLAKQFKSSSALDMALSRSTSAASRALSSSEASGPLRSESDEVAELLRRAELDALARGEALDRTSSNQPFLGEGSTSTLHELSVRKQQQAEEVAARREAAKERRRLERERNQRLQEQQRPLPPLVP